MVSRLARIHDDGVIVTAIMSPLSNQPPYTARVTGLPCQCEMTVILLGRQDADVHSFGRKAERLLTGTPRAIADIARHSLFPKTIEYRERNGFLKISLRCPS